MVRPISQSRAKFKISYNVSIAVPCRCKDTDCTEPICIGRYAPFGKGSWRCLHCGHLYHKPDEYGDPFAAAFQSKCHLERHLDSPQCRKSRDLPLKLSYGRKLFSDEVAYTVDNPKFKIVHCNVQKFKSPACAGELTH